jgi:Ca-activated chloride channel homolog
MSNPNEGRIVFCTRVTDPIEGALLDIIVAKALMNRLVDNFDARDRVGIVTYETSIRDALAPTVGTAKPAIKDVISSFAPGGSTYMEAGLARGFKMAQTMDAAHRRVVLFTDENPNVGATTASEFEKMVREAADKNIELTVIGIGLGLDPNRLAAMSNLKGGNGFSLIDSDIQGVADPESLVERDRVMLAKMLELMQQNAPIGNLYPR